MQSAQDAYMKLLGLEVRSVSAGQAQVVTTIQPEHINFQGFVHGGFVYSLADAAFALASNSHGIIAVALSTSMQHFRPAKPGEELEAIAHQENLGRRTATYRVEVLSQGKPIALFVGTVFRQLMDGK